MVNKDSFLDYFDREGTFDKGYIEEYYKEIGQRLKQARVEASYTLLDLAKTVGLTPTAIANYESGNRQIPVHVLTELSLFVEKPISYFLGPQIDSTFVISKTLKSTIEKYSNASYIKRFIKLENGNLENIDKPAPLIPVPPHIAKDHHFACIIHDKKTDTDSYYLCKWYKPDLVPSLIPGKRKLNFYIPDSDTYVIAKIGDTDKFELTRYVSITPSATFKESKEELYNKYTFNIYAVVISRVERLVK